ncbi:MAG: nuclear transport factor 2 family protein, partial [Candidatus Neomarinimicrobiota bacterium]|nr:nuclear transport factor 2 family protein [Candidatus Neomarinimicrobiota bacterium]
MRRICLLIVLLFIQFIYAQDIIINELDAAWKKLENTVSTGDFRSFKSVYHQDAVLVNGITKNSYPIKNAFEGWEKGFIDTKSEEIIANLDVKFSERLFDEFTAHETGIFHYYTINKNGDKNDTYVHFESLWVKKNNKWKM